MRNKRLIILFSVLLSITLLVVFNSVLFSVQHVYASCLNVEKSNYDEAVLSSHKIKKGTSIFFVDKAKVTKNVEQATGSRVKVLNVEKSFPNRIYINYVEVKAYVRINTKSSGMRYIRNDMVIMEPDQDEAAVELILGEEIDSLKSGESFAYKTANGLSASDILTQIINGFESCGSQYGHNEFVSQFASIDLSGSFIELKMKSGLTIQIISAQSLAQKMRFAVSVYVSPKFSQISEGTLIITGEQRASYRYPNGKTEEV